jgi:hypothetical protein
MQLEDSRNSDAGDQHKQCAGNPGKEAIDEEEHRECCGCGQQRPQVALRDMRKGVPQLHVGRAGSLLDSHQLWQLLNDDGQGDSENESLQDRLGDEIGDETELQYSGEQEQQTHDERHRRSQHNEFPGILGGQRSNGRGQNCGRSRGGRHGQLATGAEYGIGQQAKGGGVETGLRRQTGDSRVAHGFGNEQAGQRDASDHVTAKIGARVVRQPLGDGKRLHASSQYYASTSGGKGIVCLLPP